MNRPKWPELFPRKRYYIKDKYVQELEKYCDELEKEKKQLDNALDKATDLMGKCAMFSREGKVYLNTKDYWKEWLMNDE